MKKILALPLFLICIIFSLNAQKPVATSDNCKEKITQAKAAYLQALKKTQIKQEAEQLELKKKYAAKNEALNKKYGIEKNTSIKQDAQYRAYANQKKLLAMSLEEERAFLNKKQKQHKNKESEVLLKKLNALKKECSHSQTLEQKSKVKERKAYKRQ